MNKEQLEVDLVAKAHQQTHKIRQPSWAAHCMALSFNLDSAQNEAEEFKKRDTIPCLPIHFHPTPLATPIPKLDKLPTIEEVDNGWVAG